MIQRVPAAGSDLPPDANPAMDNCAECGDSIAWCPIWTAKWPDLERFRDV